MRAHTTTIGGKEHLRTAILPIYPGSLTLPPLKPRRLVARRMRHIQLLHEVRHELLHESVWRARVVAEHAPVLVVWIEDDGAADGAFRALVPLPAVVLARVDPFEDAERAESVSAGVWVQRDRIGPGEL